MPWGSIEMQFPMYVLPIKTLLEQEQMTSFEDLQAAGHRRNGRVRDLLYLAPMDGLQRA